jgi:uncharacterized protein YyaL (SSP411 family)
MANALAAETSPYLKAHSENPVDWLPWGPEAFERARRRDLPLFVSIGYSACHWCHVMERESFEDPVTAAYLNEHFVAVKIDREERPDIDGIYMEAVQAMTGHGGWPLSVFLAPDQSPFYGGTYWPPEPRSGMASFRQVLEAVVGIWTTRRAELEGMAARLTAHLTESAAREPSEAHPQGADIAAAIDKLAEGFDLRNGGFGGAPKFPPHCALDLLLRTDERNMSLATLRAMARGGICDQVGGGFARYAVDATWTVPHFEKMLYDNALLARAYLNGWRRSGDALLLRTCRDTLDFCLRELRSPEGGFYSSLDADSGGIEGSFYVWTLDELHAVLGRRAKASIAYFGASENGNFEGANVLEARGPEPADRERIRSLLLAARSERVRPALDDKRLTAWNALMIAALADAGAALCDSSYLEAAVGAAEFVWNELRDQSGRLLRTYNDGQAKLPGYLEDHAFLLEALLTLYEATFDERYFTWSTDLAERLLTSFADADNGGFFDTALDSEVLIARRKSLEDLPIPAGASSAALGLLRLGALSGEQRYSDAALGAIAISYPLATRYPSTFAYALSAADFCVARVREVALVGADIEPLATVLREGYRPHVVIAGAHDGGASAIPLLKDRHERDGRAAAYVCERFVCAAPVSEPHELRALLDAD